MKKYLLFSIVIFNLSFSNAQVTGSFVDKRNNKKYKTILVGDQTWMAENLSVTKFRNGDPIPQVLSGEQWEKAGIEGKPAWCYYENDKKNLKTYGVLYNYYAITDPRGIVPEGWHIPSKEEWESLINQLGGPEIAGEKLKSRSGWTEYFDPIEIDGKYIDQYKSGNGKDEVGFKGLPGSYRFYPGLYGYCGSGEAWSGPCGLLHESYWWTTTQIKDDYYNEMVVYRMCLFNTNSSSIFDMSRKGDGLYLRCIKD